MLDRPSSSATLGQTDMDESSSPSRRNLRPRREGQSFAQLFQFPDTDEEMGNATGSSDDDGASKRKKLPPLEEPISDSEYDPGEEPAAEEIEASASASEGVITGPEDAGSEELLEDDESVLDLNLADSTEEPRGGRRAHQRVRSIALASKRQEPVVATFNFTQKRPGNRTAPPNLATVRSRDRSSLLHTYPGPSRRLSKKPSPFEPPHFVETNGHPTSTSSRLTKAWSSNVFPGPTWELLEDEAFYKEIQNFNTGERERPIVHPSLLIRNETFELLEESCVPISKRLSDMKAKPLQGLPLLTFPQALRPARVVICNLSRLSIACLVRLKRKLKKQSAPLESINYVRSAHPYPMHKLTKSSQGVSAQFIYCFERRRPGMGP